MTTLEYYFSNGDHVTFDNYTIDTDGVVTNVNTGTKMTRHVLNTYNVVNIRDNNGTRRGIRVSRAIASTFLGKPPTTKYTADHEDQDRLNDVLRNICWASKSEQVKNRTMPEQYNSAYCIIKDNVEKTAREWIEVFKKPNGEKYTAVAITKFAQRQEHGFRIKPIEDIPDEEWKVVKGSQNKVYVSSEGRLKYKTSLSEKVLTADQLSKHAGYPVVWFSNRSHYCHVIAFKTFFPEEYIAKKDDEIILHIGDNKLDFRPNMLTLGTRSQNTIDAHNNGRHDNTNSARKSIVSYVNGVLEKEHESLANAVEYLRQHDHPRADRSGIRFGLQNGGVRYGRTWKPRKVDIMA
ncbi:hypothetical protein ATCVNEJV2_702L [Acanthocystis turfacea Chlorella virus NE-JV-2]|nr:hypothetical protein ATCVNEJV2_702L [Acanthocystis turfacea Chlorella virus NE-JV-2]